MTSKEMLDALEMARDTGISAADVASDSWDDESDGSLPATAPYESNITAAQVLAEYGIIPMKRLPEDVHRCAIHLYQVARNERWHDIVDEERRKGHKVGGGKRRHSPARRKTHRSAKAARPSGLGSIVASINRLTK